MNIILSEFLSAILGTFRTGSVRPLEEMRHKVEAKGKRAEGNVVSAEFNLLYRVSDSSSGGFCLSLSLVVLAIDCNFVVAVARHYLPRGRTVAPPRTQEEPPSRPPSPNQPRLRVDQAGFRDRKRVCDRSTRP
jgi:hypothetical protein